MRLYPTRPRGRGRICPLTIAQAREAIAAMRAGESPTVVAARFGVSYPTIVRIETGVIRRMADGILTDAATR